MIIDNDADDIYVLFCIELTPAQSHKSVRNLIYKSGHIICKFLLQRAGGKRLKDFMAVTRDFVFKCVFLNFNHDFPFLADAVF